MDLKNNYLSIIALGHFNPSILTPDFLIEQEIHNFKSPPKGSTSPILSNIKFGNISFLIEMNRFQIMHEKLESFEETPIISIMTRYLEVLKYTPIFVEGINFNLSLINFENNKAVQNIYRNPLDNLTKFLEKNDEYIFDVKTKISEGSYKTEAINCKFYKAQGISLTINLKRPNDKKINLNYNFEVGEIKSDRSRIQIILDNYSEIYKNFAEFIDKIKT